MPLGQWECLSHCLLPFLQPFLTKFDELGVLES